MMSTNELRQRPAGRCPTHRDEGTVSTLTRESGPLIMRQHRCGDGCDRPLGWDFQDHERGTFLHGHGECQDPRVDTAFSTRRNEELTAPLIGMAATGACIIAALVIMPAINALCANDPGVLPFALKGLGIVAPLEAACLLGIRALRRRRPKRPEYDPNPEVRDARQQGGAKP